MTEWFNMSALQNAFTSVVFPALLTNAMDASDSKDKLAFIGRLRLTCRAIGFDRALREEQMSTAMRLANAPSVCPTFYQCVCRVLRGEMCVAIIPNFTRHLSSQSYHYKFFRTNARALPSILRQLAEQYERQGDGYVPATGGRCLVSLTRQAFNRRKVPRIRKLLWLWSQLRPAPFLAHLPFND